jgi:hypothetical protein
MSVTPKAAATFGRIRSKRGLFVPISFVLSSVLSASAFGDIYRWIDENGSTNFSNVPPAPGGKEKNIKVVAKETPVSAPAPDREMTPTEQALQARLKEVERQLQAAKIAAQIAAQSPPRRSPAAPGNYYPTIQPPPAYTAPPPDYYAGNYDNGYSGGYDPGYYPGYYYPVVPVYPYAAFPVRAYYGRPGFAGSRAGSFGGSFRGGGGHGGGHGGR